MARKRSAKTATNEALIQQALKGIKDKTYKSAYQAAKKLGIRPRTLYDRVKKGKSRSQARVAQQHLLESEEQELARWIRNLTISGTPAQYSLVREMAEHIRNRRDANVNDESTEHAKYPPLGKQWVHRFLLRHPQLKSVVGARIEASRLNSSTKEVFTRWFDAFKKVKMDNKIDVENIYNMDETGTALGTVQASRVIIDKNIGSQFQGEPGRQEWVTVVECICADETSIPPMIIFKAAGLNEQILPENIAPEDWKFAYNTKGWTSNAHGFEWLRRCFEPSTREKANGGYRLLICDGHDSHITAKFIEYCMDHKIILMVLPPHTSHLLQPLDVGVFGPVKTALSSQVKRYINTGIAKLRKSEWLTSYVKARPLAITRSNIEAGWRGSGLWPLNPSKAIRRLPRLSTPSPEPQIVETPSIFETTLLTSSPPDATVLHSATTALNQLAMNGEPFNTPVRGFIPRLTNHTERLAARVSILEHRVKDVESVLGARKHHESGKRMVLKDQLVYTISEVLQGVKDAEKATAERKKKTAKRVRQRGRIVIPEVVLSSDDSEDQSDKELKQGDSEISDCIRVRRRR
jgi:DDE superfamily endonuclease/Tc5 transposase DNA-binding domain